MLPLNGRARVSPNCTARWKDDAAESKTSRVMEPESSRTFGEDALRNTIREFVTHYHLERNHQGLDNRLIVPMKTIAVNGTIRRYQRLGGMLNYYYREAA
jgi:Arc/MetJ family transcription regulator